MILHSEIKEKAKLWNMTEEIIEKDYALGWVLWGIAKHPKLSKWVLKGGACIKKCYVDTHRYSQDLDFTVLSEGIWQPSELEPILGEIVQMVSVESGLDFNVKKPTIKERPSGSIEIKLYFNGPRGNPSPTAIKLDIMPAEELASPPILRPISHKYSDANKFPDSLTVRCYAFDEVFGEKLRAIGERTNPSDLYDVIYLFRREDLNAEPELIMSLLESKCSSKGIAVPSIDTIMTEQVKGEIQKRWDNKLKRALASIPQFDLYWDTLPNLFAWLNGEETDTGDLESIKGERWQPSPVHWEGHDSKWKDVITFAAVNELVIDLGYQNTKRLIEPYSMRLSSQGKLLLYGWKIKDGRIGSYRIDRIKSIEVTKNPFSPRYEIEFIKKGHISAPPRIKRNRKPAHRRKHRYVVQCPACGKEFYRKTYGATLNAHTREGTSIPCVNRIGVIVSS